MADVATALLAPNFDAPLKKHVYAASFGSTARKPGEEPGFEAAGRSTDVHVYTDREKTSFLKETRGGAAWQPLHVPKVDVPRPPATAPSGKAAAVNPPRPPATAPPRGHGLVRPRVLAPLQTSEGTDRQGVEASRRSLSTQRGHANVPKSYT